MLKCLIWGIGRDYDRYINLVKFHEITNEIKVIGIICNETYLNTLDGYKIINKETVKDIEYDVLLIASVDKFLEILDEAIQVGFDKDEIINIKALEIPNFTFEKYLRLKKSKISLFSNLCWAGSTYNRLCLEFLSPTINMFESEKDYLKLMGNLKEYLEYPLEFKENGYDKNQNKEYPICTIGDVTLNMNHYKSFEEAFEKWELRKNRINWDNIFVMMYTQNIDTLLEFNDLPYSKKVCFVPFKSDVKSAFYLELCQDSLLKEIEFWQIVNGLATSSLKYYDIFKLLDGEFNRDRIM